MKSPNNQDRPWVIALTKMKDRMEEPVQWFPFPAMISFMFVVILGGHLLPGLNPRLGARVDSVAIKAPRQPDGGIWLGVYLQDDLITVITSDRNKFKWAAKSPRLEDIEPLVQYLKSKTQHESFSMALKLESSLTKTTAVIGLNQDLTYAHMKPIIFALASANIFRYGFETRIIN